ncbi:TPA: hypothetical protein JHK51_002300 [Escherichia coli]|nr:hypothetical protein [Escherichia coli]
MFLRLFFRESYPFTTEKVYLSQIPGLVNMALYVSPIVSGEVIRSRGGSTSEFTPGYVKPKHEVNPQMTLRRLPDEDPQNLADPAYRRRRIILQNMRDEELAIAQVEEMQAVSAVLKGKYTMTGEAFDPVEVDISGSVNANSGTLNNVTINENCQIKGKLSANQIEGDIVKTVSKSFPRTNSYASGTITVRISDDQKFDRQVMIPPVLFRGGKHENFNSNNQQSYWYSTCRLRVTRNGQEIFNQSTTDAQGVFSSVIDMPAGQGTLTLTFTVSSSGANNWTPTTSISDLLVVVMKKSTAGISIS